VEHTQTSISGALRTACGRTELSIALALELNFLPPYAVPLHKKAARHAVDHQCFSPNLRPRSDVCLRGLPAGGNCTRTVQKSTLGRTHLRSYSQIPHVWIHSFRCPRRRQPRQGDRRRSPHAQTPLRSAHYRQRPHAPGSCPEPVLITPIADVQANCNRNPKSPPRISSLHPAAHASSRSQPRRPTHRPPLPGSTS
jgi:hypothetical protein